MVKIPNSGPLRDGAVVGYSQYDNKNGEQMLHDVVSFSLYFFFL